MSNNNYKRQYRQMDDATKAKISQKLSGRSLSPQHAQRISDGLKNYWEQIPNAPVEADENKSTNPQNDATM